jgi:hypothetical protein
METIKEILKTIRWLVDRVADDPVRLSQVLMFLVALTAMGLVLAAMYLLARR